MCLSRSEPLRRVVDHTSSRWVTILKLLLMLNIQCTSASESFSSVSTNENDWPCIQQVSCFPLFDLIRTPDYMSRMWVVIQSLSWSEPLMRITNSVSRVWVFILVFELIRTTDKWLITYPECESLSSIWADLNHWHEWLIIGPACELFPSVWADQKHW